MRGHLFATSQNAGIQDELIIEGRDSLWSKRVDDISTLFGYLHCNKYIILDENSSLYVVQQSINLAVFID